MRAHIVYAHPEPQSFVASMCERTRRALIARGFQVSVSDLYALQFNPVASADDFKERRNPNYLVYALEQRDAWRKEALPPDVRREVEFVRQSDLLVLTFPIFWFSVPAILKGWIDRVFLSGVFYGGKWIYDRGGMAGKRALVVASLGGREHMFGNGAIHGHLEGMLRHLLQGTLGYVGYDVLQPFFAHHVPYIEESERAKILDRLDHHIEQHDRLPVMQMPCLDEYDGAFRPL